MTDREDLSKSELMLGFELSKKIRDAHDPATTEGLILDAALKLPRADRVYLAQTTARGDVEITRRSDEDLPSPDEERECLDAAREALERHRKRCVPPGDLGTNDARIKETDESIPLSVVAKVLPDRQDVLGIIIIVRGGHAPFTEDERGSFSRVADHAASGLARRSWFAPKKAPDPGTPGVALRRDPERLTGKDLGDLSARFPEIVGPGPANQKVLAEIARAAATDMPVLILGESGTGKELVAGAIHRASKRSRGPYVPVNMGAINPSLAESEFFGHEIGAYTGATKAAKGLFRDADGGTIFLDEAGELALEIQPKLLRVLELRKVRPVGLSGEVAVDFRLVAATNQSLALLIEAGKFRADLYYRLLALEIHVPPLRERREDLRPLVEHFVRKLGATADLTREAWALIERHPWPGNVRQLAHAVERALTSGHATLEAEDFGVTLEDPTVVAEEDPESRRARFQKAYEACGRKLVPAARLLHVHRSTVGLTLGLWANKSRSRKR